MRKLAATVFLFIAGLFVSSCSGGEKSPTGPGGVTVSISGQISDYINAAQLAGSLGTTINPSTGSVPAGGGGPSVTVRGATVVSSAGSGASFTIESATPFKTIFVSATGKSGFIQIDLPSAVTSQGILLLFATLPSSVTVQFQAATSGGTAGPAASLSITSVAEKVGSLSAAAHPDPVAFSGKTCTIMTPVDPAFGCTYETRVDLAEVGGSAITVTQYVATWNFGGSAGTRTFSSATLPGGQAQIAAAGSVLGFPVFYRCSTPTCDASFFAVTAGTMSFTVTGTDASGHALSFQSQAFTLLPGQ